MILNHAISLAQKGFYVFPIVPNTKIPPKGFHFKVEATRDLKKIHHWWTNGYSNHNIGIYTGKFKESEALLVVDVDTKKGKMGEDDLIRLELEGLDFPTTLEQRTPSGGRHLIYKTPEATGQPDLTESINTRSDGGYILGPGSVLSNGKYVLGNGEISEAPTGLVSRCGRPLAKSNDGPTLGAYIVNSENAQSRARYYLETLAPPAIQGAHGDATTILVAFKVKDLGVSEQECFDLMAEIWNERCSPPWQLEDLRAKVGNAYRHGKLPQGVDSPEAVFTKIETVETIEPQKPKERKRSLYGEEFHEVEPNFNQNYLVENLLSPSAMSVIYGESGSGKTFFALDLSLHISLGQLWHNRKTTPGLVIYVAAEGGWGIRKRIKAFRKYHKLEGRNDVPFVLVPCPIDLLNPNTHVNELLTLIRKYEDRYSQRSALIVIDTLARALGGGNENAPSDMGAFVKNIAQIGNTTDAHVMVIHHSGKDTAKGARGHSSLRAATDTEVEISDLTAKTKKQRDQEFGEDIGFRLEQIEIGKKPNGEAVKSCVVLPSNTSAAKNFSKTPLDPDSLAGKGFKSLQNATDWNGVPPLTDLDLPDETLMVPIDDWRNAFYELAYQGTEKKKSWYEAFIRVSKSLLKSGHIGKTEEFAWIV